MYYGMKAVRPGCWIWSSNKVNEGYKNQYVYFKRELEVINHFRTAVINISVDTDYALWINDAFVSCGQYLSYPHIKFYDSIDVGKYLKNGVNTILLLAYYEGADTASYVKGHPGVFVEIIVDNSKYYTDEEWLCSDNTGYQNGEMYHVTSQIGFGFIYDARRKKNDWKKVASCQRDASLPDVIYERPIKKLVLQQPQIKTINSYGKFFLVDLENEISGFPTFSLTAQAGTSLKITYEEHVGENTKILPDPGGREFCFYYTTGGGKETFAHYLRKISCRYLQIEADSEIHLESLGIVPVEYPVPLRQKPDLSPIHSRIYDICVRTLKNCMHEKYEDTPWREQAMYAQDARNQALYGYKVFHNKEFPLACLKLIKESIDEDGFVRLTAPSSANRCIPFFSYMWVLMLTDYYKNGGQEEETLLLLHYAENLLQTHMNQYGKNGFLIMPEKEGVWNFYEWSDGLDGAYYDENGIWRILPYNSNRYDAILNLYFLMALNEMIMLLENLKLDALKYREYSLQLSEKVNSIFYNKEKGLYCSYVVDKKQQHYCELTQSLAILTGVCHDEIKESLINILTNSNDLIKPTLSCMLYKFDAILKSKTNHRSFVMNEIERIFAPMLSDKGTGCCWETEKGKSDFRGCGSMCHGWSAFPLYFY